MTYGIRTGESVLITAQEGVGSTEVMHAILHNILTETSVAVGSIFLEEPKKRLLQSIAGIDLKRPVHLPDSGSVMQRHSKRYAVSYRRMSVFMSIVILDQMILKSFSDTIQISGYRASPVSLYSAGRYHYGC